MTGNVDVGHYATPHLWSKQGIIFALFSVRHLMVLNHLSWQSRLNRQWFSSQVLFCFADNCENLFLRVNSEQELGRSKIPIRSWFWFVPSPFSQNAHQQSWSLEDNVLSSLEEYPHVQRSEKSHCLTMEMKLIVSRVWSSQFWWRCCQCVTEQRSLGRALVLRLLTHGMEIWWKHSLKYLRVKLDCFNSFNQIFNHVTVWPHCDCNCIYGFICNTLKALQQTQQFKIFLFIEK